LKSTLIHKQRLLITIIVALVFGFHAQFLFSQQVAAIVEGKVTEEGAPKAKADVLLVNKGSGHTYKTKTDKNGNFGFAGIQYGSYKVQVLNKKGEVIFSEDQTVGSQFSTGNQFFEIKLAKDAQPIKDADKAGGKPHKMTKEEIKAEKEKVAAMNVLLQQAQGALQAQKWPEAETALKQVIADDPNTSKWELYRALAEAQKNQDKLDDAAKTFDKGIQVAESVAAGTAPPDPRNPNADPARARAGAGHMLNSLGSIYVRQSKMDQAIATYQKAAATDPNPALAYFNLCALAFNAGKYDDAAAACEKSSTADPKKADAWFFRGAALAKANKPGAADALNKYLQLDATGIYAAQAKTYLKSAK
jgi:tetratricopeptide (TPR) repeat protein